jgi:hypothetical protein
LKGTLTALRQHDAEAGASQSVPTPDGLLQPSRRMADTEIRMSAEAALADMLRMIHRRALKLAALPEDERDPQYDLMRLSCCGAAERIGQSPDRAAMTAGYVVDFTRAMVDLIEANRAAGTPH